MSDESNPVNLAALPTALRELVQVLGEADAFRLIGAHGGARVTVPKTPGAEHPLRMAFSEKGFALFVRHYGGETMELPKGDAYLRELRHDQVRQARVRGQKVDEIAEETGYSRRHVINILGGKAAVKDTLTGDLFANLDEPCPRVQSQAGQANDPFGLGRSASR